MVALSQKHSKDSEKSGRFLKVTQLTGFRAGERNLPLRKGLMQGLTQHILSTPFQLPFV